MSKKYTKTEVSDDSLKLAAWRLGQPSNEGIYDCLDGATLTAEGAKRYYLDQCVIQPALAAWIEKTQALLQKEEDLASEAADQEKEEAARVEAVAIESRREARRQRTERLLEQARNAPKDSEGEEDE